MTDDGATPVYADTGYTFDTLASVSGRRIVGETTDAEGVTTLFEHDADGNLTRETVPTSFDGDAQTDWVYDSRGNVILETKVVSRTPSLVTVDTASTYNATNDVLSRTDADNDASVRTVTRYSYDVAGRLVSEDRNCTTSGTTIPGQGAGGSCTGAGTQNADTNVITNYAYTGNDQLAFEQDPLGRVTKHVYDADGNETSTIANCTTSGTTQPSPFDSCTAAGIHDAATNVTTTSTFGSNADHKPGLVESSTNALGTTTYDYDALGQVTETVLPGDASAPALTTDTTYDEYGGAVTETAGWTVGGSATSETTLHVFDKLGRETQVTDPEGTITATTFDVAGNATATVVAPAAPEQVTTTRSFYENRQLETELAGNPDSGGGETMTYSDLGVVSPPRTPCKVRPTSRSR